MDEWTSCQHDATWHLRSLEPGTLRLNQLNYISIYPTGLFLYLFFVSLHCPCPSHLVDIPVQIINIAALDIYHKEARFHCSLYFRHVTYWVHAIIILTTGSWWVDPGVRNAVQNCSSVCFCMNHEATIVPK